MGCWVGFVLLLFDWGFFSPSGPWDCVIEHAGASWSLVVALLLTSAFSLQTFGNGAVNKSLSFS